MDACTIVPQGTQALQKPSRPVLVLSPEEKTKKTSLANAIERQDGRCRCCSPKSYLSKKHALEPMHIRTIAFDGRHQRRPPVPVHFQLFASKGPSKFLGTCCSVSTFLRSLDSANFYIETREKSRRLLQPGDCRQGWNVLRSCGQDARQILSFQRAAQLHRTNFATQLFWGTCSPRPS